MLASGCCGTPDFRGKLHFCFQASGADRPRHRCKHAGVDLRIRYSSPRRESLRAIQVAGSQPIESSVQVNQPASTHHYDEIMKAVFAGKAQPGAVGAAKRLLASGLAIVTVNSPATRHALQEAGIAHQDVREPKKKCNPHQDCCLAFSLHTAMSRMSSD